MSQLVWQKSSFSEAGATNCLEVASSTPDTTHLRESDDPHTVLTTTPAGLGALIRAIKAGAYDDGIGT
ncbi:MULTISPECIES: DUF397 domain-containing protein [Streptomycetaceae]|uniref:DUF397 domain-containing protein n=1 Tax=Streptantibioticus cattleyicolor (strain ATCC 35852 / DSM 46488 / JCM 4925 / NBRC 14057 / NRRL 8057) TaxID=1003195 RepID=F8K3K4_STREN|nr:MULTISPECIES: DUF397 domain-containing protein [Streptomycetaceae]AEW96322.1 hypothetical protein SCATT_39510 [Streptantibioticus cattleyicolor NRRL 8057 = DSM 46488]MYS60837.1 DUF397 domain-containing protein [Streptomyces sp. SID5468]CCB76662.1 conserved protein of unknown function [Streptantibioticus cattleyicolor NRRL 8057 = DSM 46488]